jgi:hypothetical protein
MSSAPGSPPVTFRPVRYRRGSQVLGGIGAVGFGIAAIASAGKVAKDGAGLVVVGVVLLVLGVVFLVGRRGRTTIDGQGLYASSPFGGSQPWLLADAGSIARGWLHDRSRRFPLTRVSSAG